MTCISHTGRIPMCAAPAAAPMIAASDIGVSITRCSPYFAINPSVTLNAPPYAPMSSPRQKTFLSSSISSKRPSRIASRYVISDIVRAPAGRTLVHVDGRLDSLSEPEWSERRWIGVDPNQRVRGIRHWRRLGLVCGAVDLVLDALVRRCKCFLLESIPE